MKILPAAALPALDAATCAAQNISSGALMDRAAGAFAEAFFRLFDLGDAPDVLVLGGPGNNGGDGLAIARYLHLAGYAVRVALLPAARYSADYQQQRPRLPAAVPVAAIDPENLPVIAPTTVVVDALFGTGLRRPLAGLAAAVVAHLRRAAPAAVVAVDVPSGLFANAPQPADSPIVAARFTLSFGGPKLAFLLPQNADFVGEWQALDIGLDPSAIAQTATDWHLTTPADLAGSLPRRARFSHKGTFGHGLLLAGQRGQLGAAVLAAGAALHGGIGLLTAAVPGGGYAILQTAVPEALCRPDPHPDHLTELPDLAPYQAVALGPGLGQHPAARALLEALLRAAAPTPARPRPLPLVLDADALNLLGRHRELLDLLPPDTLLTPHPKEFERLTEPARDDYHRLELLQDFARRTRCLVLLKGAYSALATPAGALHFNATGNPGLATGGSGDTLTGLLLALRADARLPAFAAARLGVFAHGRAADLAAAALGSEIGLRPSEVQRYIGRALGEAVGG